MIAKLRRLKTISIIAVAAIIIAQQQQQTVFVNKHGAVKDTMTLGESCSPFLFSYDVFFLHFFSFYFFFFS